MNLRFFFRKISVIPEFSLMQTRAKSNVSLSFGKKRCKIGLLILNISSLSSKNLRIKEFWKNPTLFSFFAKILGYQQKLKLNNGVENMIVKIT